MKISLAILWVFVCYIALGVTQTSDSTANSCTDQSHCGSAECCVHEGIGIGKKKRSSFLFGDSHGLFGEDHSHGVCRAKSKLNAHCIPSFLGHDLFNQQLYQSFCPCEDGLECRGETVDEGPHSISHTNPKCQASEK